MKTKKRHILLNWTMVLVMLVSVVYPLQLSSADDSEPIDITGKVSETFYEVMLTLNPDPGEDPIDASEGISLEMAFGVPVAGDKFDGDAEYNTDEYEPIEYESSYQFVLSENFSFSEVKEIPLKIDEDTQIGKAILKNVDGKAIVEISFNGPDDVFGESDSGVKVGFNASLKYNGNFDESEEGNERVVKILEKEYGLYLPVTYALKKTVGEPELDEETNEWRIKWQVVINATEKDNVPATHIDLGGYVFKDDLSKAGSYVDGTFKIVSGSDSTVLDNTVTVEDEGTTLSYLFPDGATSPITITYETKIPDEIMVNGDELSNDAKLFSEEEEPLAEDNISITIDGPLAEKEGKLTNEGVTGGVYNPANRQITWYIEVNNKGKTLYGLTITDELEAGLEFKEA